MAPNLLHIVTGLQYEVQAALVLSHLLGSHFTTWVQYIATMRTNSTCNSGVSKKRREALMSRVCSFSFEGARITL